MSERTTMLPTIEDRLAEMEARLERGSVRMGLIELAVEENTRITEAGNAVGAEVRDMLATGKTVVKVFNWIGRTSMKLLVWAGKVAGAALALYGAFYAATHSGGLPPK